ncbi:hypothetical protein HID58_006653 [Brassica napus]|uniref:Uncharacterized protein n=1 Tax=Brassica napus TaxID=3708 RepID=A0ABQ8EC04_BRANA|nr:hypothetical protein HID58_006653 [Brassica napus]
MESGNLRGSAEQKFGNGLQRDSMETGLGRRYDWDLSEIRSREEPRKEGEFILGGSDRGRLQQEVEKSLKPITPTGPAQATSQLPGDHDQVTPNLEVIENGLYLVSQYLEDGTNTIDKDKINEDLEWSKEKGIESHWDGDRCSVGAC